MDKLKYLYNEMVKNIEKNNIRSKDKGLTSLFHMKGKLYEGDLMVIGRAVNGWDEASWIHRDLIDDSKVDKHIEKIIDVSVKTTDCPLNWVNEAWGRVEYDENGELLYNTKKSAFWRVIYNLMCEMKLEDQWWSRIVWSNLYKVAPSEGGNPNETLIKLQKEKCAEILKEEINIYKPKRILFLCGLDWLEPFIGLIDQIKVTEKSGLVEAVGSYNFKDGTTSKIVVAKHPQGKDESKMILEIIEGFNS